MGEIPPLLVGVGLFGSIGIRISGSPHRRVRCGRKLDFCGVIAFGFQVLLYLNQSWKRSSWGFSRAKD